MPENLKFVTSSDTPLPGKWPNLPRYCVEVAFGEDGVYVRDSKQGENGLRLKFSDAEWEAFLNGVKRGEFDLPEAREATAEALLEEVR